MFTKLNMNNSNRKNKISHERYVSIVERYQFFAKLFFERILDSNFWQTEKMYA